MLDTISYPAPRGEGSTKGDNSALLVETQGEEDGNGPPKDSATPWYLQVDIPQSEARPLLKTQQLPELPADPPPLLEPMLQHISVDLGLDDLTLFDLRDIDPPPALGANVLMILGTARSEKHLHVSADRFCRWLKTNHKLSPYADGLLGRGELKLKLRRKAKRARLLSNVGSSETSSVDDGIRTGWICVNVGKVPDGRDSVVHKAVHDEYVGFGEDIEGANVVIQMLTQEKREELDLEGLWGKVMRRHEKREARVSEGTGPYQPTQEAAQSLMHEERALSDPSFTLASRSRQSGIYTQARAYSTAAAASLAVHHDPVLRIDLKESRTPSAKSVPEMTLLDPFQEHVPYDQKSPEVISRLSRLQGLFENLRKLPLNKMQEMLAQQSSSFWTSFDDIYPLFPDIRESECRLSVLCFAHEIGAVSGKDAIVRMLQEMEATFVEIPERVFILALKAILTPDSGSSGRSILPTLTQQSLYHAADILEHMSLRGYNIATEDVRSRLQVAVLRASSESTMQFSVRTDAFQRLRGLMRELFESPASIDAEVEMLHHCADAAKWDNFWDLWRGFARAMRPRPKALYIAMFIRIAQRGHQAETMRALREWLPEMANEEPPVVMDVEIAKAIKACLLIVEPNIPNFAAHEDAFGEWVHLWRRCNRAVLGCE
ncbi:MAG: hypothetical protein Q9163_006103 [Psora crenata]